MADEFGLKSNAAPVSQADAVATIEKVAGEPAPIGKPDQGVAQADGKQVSDDQFRKEFELDDSVHPDDKKIEGKPEVETEVKTELEDEEKEQTADEKAADEKAADEKAADEKAAAEKKETVEDETGEAVADWLKDVDVATRQEILDEFSVNNIDDLMVSIRQGGEDVDLSIGELKRAAAGYAGEDAVDKKVENMKAELGRREEDVKTREDFFGKQFDDPQDLLTFLDANVTDPVKYFTALKEHAEGVLTEAEDNPAQFRRNTAMRRENQSLRSDITEIKDILKGNRDTGRDTDAEESESPEVVKERRTEGQRRRDAVVRAGFDVNKVHQAWTDDGEAVDFDRWFARWSKTAKKETSTGKKKTTEKKQRRGGSALRRRGPVTPKPASQQDDGDLSAKGIAKFLREHPSNQGR